MRTISVLFTLLFLASATPAIAEIPERCIVVGETRKISTFCGDFERRIGQYRTPVRTLEEVGCPKEIIVRYTDPETNKVETHVANRRGTSILTCKGGAMSIGIAPESSPSRPAARPSLPQGRPSGPPAVAQPQQPVAPQSLVARPAERPSPPPAVSAPTPAKPKLWNATAAGIWHVNGAVQVSIGYSGARRTPEEARSSALQACQSGGQNCKASQAFDFGCLYIATGRNSRGAGWVTSYTSAKTTERCREQGYTSCRTPIGGCVE